MVSAGEVDDSRRVSEDDGEEAPRILASGGAPFPAQFVRHEAAGEHEGSWVVRSRRFVG